MTTTEQCSSREDHGPHPFVVRNASGKTDVRVGDCAGHGGCPAPIDTQTLAELAEAINWPGAPTLREAVQEETREALADVNRMQTELDELTGKYDDTWARHDRWVEQLQNVPKPTGRWGRTRYGHKVRRFGETDHDPDCWRRHAWCLAQRVLADQDAHED